MFSIDIVASAPDDPNVQNVFHIRKYGMQYTPAGPIFFGGNIYIYSRRVGIILQNSRQNPKISKIAKLCHSFKCESHFFNIFTSLGSYGYIELFCGYTHTAFADSRIEWASYMRCIYMIYIYIYINVYVCICIYICVYVYVYICIC